MDQARACVRSLVWWLIKRRRWPSKSKLNSSLKTDVVFGGASVEGGGQETGRVSVSIGQEVTCNRIEVLS